LPEHIRKIHAAGGEGKIIPRKRYIVPKHPVLPPKAGAAAQNGLFYRLGRIAKDTASCCHIGNYHGACSYSGILSDFYSFGNGCARANKGTISYVSTCPYAGTRSDADLIANLCSGFYYGIGKEAAARTDFTESSHPASGRKQIAVTHFGVGRKAGIAVNGVYRCHMPPLLQHFKQEFTLFFIFDRDEGIAFLADELEKSIVFGAAQNGNFADFLSVKSRVIVEEAVHNQIIGLKNIKGQLSSAAGAEKDDGI
jgi:hypothetical protein